MKVRNPKIRTLFFLLGIFFLIFIYFILLHYFKIADYKNNPILLFINRSFAITAVSGITLSYIIGNLKKLKIDKTERFLPLIKYLGIYGFFSAIVHIFLSLMLLEKEKFPYLFLKNGNFNSVGELTIFLGIIAISIFIFPAIASIPAVAKSMKIEMWRKYQQGGYYGMILILAHVFVVEYIFLIIPGGWVFIIPFTLLIIILLLLSLLLKMITLFLKF